MEVNFYDAGFSGSPRVVEVTGLDRNRVYAVRVLAEELFGFCDLGVCVRDRIRGTVKRFEDNNCVFANCVEVCESVGGGA